MSRFLTQSSREKLTAAFALLEDEAHDVFSVHTPSHEERALVIGRCRVALFRGSKSGKFAVVKNMHLYDLKKLSAPETTKVILTFKSGSITCAYLQKQVSSSVLEKLARAYALITYGWPRGELAVVSIRSSQRTDLFQMNSAPGYGGFREAYVSFCSWHNVKPCRALLRTVKGVAMQDRLLDISSVPGLVADNNALQPVFEALRFNRFFTGLIIAGVPTGQSQCIASLTALFEKNETINSLSLTHTAIGDISPLARAISTNKGSMLTYLDLSSDKLGDKGFSDLATVMSSSMRLETLNVANNAATGKGVAALINSLAESVFLFSSLKYIDFSKNKFGVAGSLAFCNWLNKLYEQNSSRKLSNQRKVETGLQLADSDTKMASWVLEVLILSDCHLDVGGVLRTLRQNDEAFRNFLRLDVSHNKMSLDDGQNMAKFLSVQSRLSEVNVSNTSLSGHCLSVVMHGMLKNRKLDSITIQAAGNDLGLEAVSQLEPILRASAETNLHSLSLANNNFTNEGVVRVLEALKGNTKIKKLALGANFRHNAKSAEAIGGSAGESLATLSGLETLILHGNDSCFLGNGLVPLVHHLRNNNVLVQLDVSGNHCGEEGIAVMTSLIQTCPALRVLNLDRNEFGLNGYQAFLSALKNNRNLLQFEHPVHDIQSVASVNKKKASMLEHIVESIHDLTTRNSENMRLAEIKGLQVAPAPAAADKVPAGVEQKTPKSAAPPDVRKAGGAAAGSTGVEVLAKAEKKRSPTTMRAAEPHGVSRAVKAEAVRSATGKTTAVAGDLKDKSPPAAAPARVQRSADPKWAVDREVEELEELLEQERQAKLLRKQRRNLERIARLEALEEHERELEKIELREREVELKARAQRILERERLAEDELLAQREREIAERERRLAEDERRRAARDAAERLAADTSSLPPAQLGEPPLQNTRKARRAGTRGPTPASPVRYSSSASFLLKSNTRHGGSWAGSYGGGDGFGREDEELYRPEPQPIQYGERECEEYVEAEEYMDDEFGELPPTPPDDPPPLLESDDEFFEDEEAQYIENEPPEGLTPEEEMIWRLEISRSAEK